MRYFKSGFTRIFIVVVLFAISRTCVSHYLYGTQKKKTSIYEKMVADSSFTMADLSSSYEVITLRIARVPVTYYAFKYSLSVNGVAYHGDITLGNLPKERKLKLYYLKEDPSVISLNPQAKLERRDENYNPKADLFWGILFGGVGLLVFVSILISLKNYLAVKKFKESQVFQYTQSNKQEESKTEKQERNNEDHSRFMPE